MLSLFPSLLSYEGFAPLLLRLTLGSIYIFWAYGRLRNRNNKKEMIFGITELLVGIFFIIGYFTQLVALVSIVILGTLLVQKIRSGSFLTNGVNYYLILFVISIVLLISGAGFFAFDLPL
jgi:uncharacterized membrane protein YphA (DoxX/SURF4 family)